MTTVSLYFKESSGLEKTVLGWRETEREEVPRLSPAFKIIMGTNLYYLPWTAEWRIYIYIT